MVEALVEITSGISCTVSELQGRSHLKFVARLMYCEESEFWQLEFFYIRYVEDDQP